MPYIVELEPGVWLASDFRCIMVTSTQSLVGFATARRAGAPTTKVVDRVKRAAVSRQLKEVGLKG